MECDKCGGKLEKIYYIQKEKSDYGGYTGRVRKAVSHMVCTECLSNVVTDSGYGASEWYFPKE